MKYGLIMLFIISSCGEADRLNERLLSGSDKKRHSENVEGNEKGDIDELKEDLRDLKFSLYRNSTLSIDLHQDDYNFDLVVIKTNPHAGAIEEFTDNGTFTYRPHEDFFGIDAFIITPVKDGEEREEVTLSFTVNKSKDDYWEVSGPDKATVSSCQQFVVEHFGHYEQLDHDRNVFLRAIQTGDELLLFADKECSMPLPHGVALSPLEDGKSFFAQVPITAGQTELIALSQETEDSTIRKYPFTLLPEVLNSIEISGTDKTIESQCTGPFIIKTKDEFGNLAQQDTLCHSGEGQFVFTDSGCTKEIAQMQGDCSATDGIFEPGDGEFEVYIDFTMLTSTVGGNLIYEKDAMVVMSQGSIVSNFHEIEVDSPECENGVRVCR